MLKLGIIIPQVNYLQDSTISKQVRKIWHTFWAQKSTTFLKLSQHFAIVFRRQVVSFVESLPWVLEQLRKIVQSRFPKILSMFIKSSFFLFFVNLPEYPYQSNFSYIYNLYKYYLRPFPSCFRCHAVCFYPTFLIRPNGRWKGEVTSTLFQRVWMI